MAEVDRLADVMHRILPPDDIQSLGADVALRTRRGWVDGRSVKSAEAREREQATTGGGGGPSTSRSMYASEKATGIVTFSGGSISLQDEGGNGPLLGPRREVESVIHC